MSIATPVREIEHTTHRHDDRPWRVIVRNDDHNSFEHVIVCFMRIIPGMSAEKGFKLAMEIHTSGAAVVWSGHREVAELYHAQLVSCGLTMAPLER